MTAASALAAVMGSCLPDQCGAIRLLRLLLLQLVCCSMSRLQLALVLYRAMLRQRPGCTAACCHDGSRRCGASCSGSC